ncbi:hypothetical protein GCM10011400_37350 [Paraburkholderia caffeinilytica]|uniref:Uncharacterized protein n=1 Tax=Paraburkholderia caffeinilytica TaxID=1761016 RepID=A0ABQ1N0R0_9BURK|nr:hypothetical protein GCM10011400_37350 [Paraburkholderia caffeinilytica]
MRAFLFAVEQHVLQKGWSPARKTSIAFFVYHADCFVRFMHFMPASRLGPRRIAANGTIEAEAPVIPTPCAG